MVLLSFLTSKGNEQQLYDTHVNSNIQNGCVRLFVYTLVGDSGVDYRLWGAASQKELRHKAVCQGAEASSGGKEKAAANAGAR